MVLTDVGHEYQLISFVTATSSIISV